MTVKQLQQVLDTFPPDSPAFLVALMPDGQEVWLDINELEELSIYTQKKQKLTAVGIRFSL